MIRLKDICMSEVINYSEDDRILKTLEKHKAKTVYDVVQIMSLKPRLPWENVTKNLIEVLKTMEKYNEKGREPVIFKTKEYTDASLRYNDSLNKASILLLDNPTQEYSTRYRAITYMQIAELTEKLVLTKANGANYILSYARNIGQLSMQQISKSIEMYRDQIERQALLTSDRSENLFEVDYKERRMLVEEKYADIIMYLLSNTNSQLVWGKLTDVQKKLYYSSINNDKQIDCLISDRMKNIIANYTTLPELEDVKKGNAKVLTRFIKK